MRSWQGEKVRVLGVQGLHRVSRFKLQASPLTQRLYGFRGQEGKLPTKTTKKKLGDKCSKTYKTRCTRGVRVVFSVTRMRSSNSARINKFDFRTEKSCSVHMTVFEIVAGHNVVN